MIFLAYPESRPVRSIEDRLKGFRRALEEASITFSSERVVRFSEGRSWKPLFEEGMKRLRAQSPLPEVIFAPTDKVAHETSLFLRERGMAVPGTVEICGADNIQEEEWHEHFVTTQTDFTAVGQRAAEILIEQINNPAVPASRVILPGRIVTPHQDGKVLPFESSFPGALTWADEILSHNQFLVVVSGGRSALVPRR